jgi:thioredoxin-like negative regulator of GroEL
MYSILAYILVAGVAMLIVLFLNRAPELRHGRLSQLILVPGALVLALWILRQTEGRPDYVSRIAVIGIIGFTATMLAPSIAYNFGIGLSNFLDPQDWTPAEEEIALRPIRRLIDRDQYYQALGDLDALLKKHKPTYEALLLHAKLLHHFGRVEDTAAALLKSIPLSHTTAQQLVVLELLAILEERLASPPQTPVPGTRRLRIEHELVLFQPNAADRSLHNTIPPGSYQVEETLHRQHRWLKLAEENWGNAQTCWQAVQEIQRPPPVPQKKGFLRQIARMHQAISVALKGRPRLYSQAEAGQLLQQANQFIRREDWQGAVALLEKASACDPHRYEIAYRWVQAVRHTADARATARAVKKVLAQNQWSPNEQEMLRQVLHPSHKG